MDSNPILGIVVATPDSPTPSEYKFVVSDKIVRDSIEIGKFVQVKQQNFHILGIVQSLIRNNRYFSSTDVVHGSSQGLSPPSIFPTSRWDYIVATVKVLGAFKEKIQIRNTRPILPGLKVELVNEDLLNQFLGFDNDGLAIGKLIQANILAKINLDKLLQKHLAILSISGGGKSYTTSVLIEELLLRDKYLGRPALVLFDVHGEYKSLLKINKKSIFKNAEVIRIPSDQINLATGNINSSDFGRFFPSSSNPQKRDLEQVLYQLRRKNQPFGLDTIINEIIQKDMNLMVKDALLGWLYQLKSTHLFSNMEYPNLEEIFAPGRLIIFDLSDFTSLWSKRIIIHYYLTRIFELRRSRIIPPIVSILEEAHQFCPEVESSSCKSIIHTIAREGRKFLCSLVLISQRPVNLSTTALSQCNSHLILRIVNPHDLTYIGRSSEGINSDTLNQITQLGVGEALLVGEAVKYPIFIQIRQKIIKTDFDENALSSESTKYEKIKNLVNEEFYHAK